MKQIKLTDEQYSLLSTILAAVENTVEESEYCNYENFMLIMDDDEKNTFKQLIEKI